jgi:hypothetical protein
MIPQATPEELAALRDVCREINYRYLDWNNDDINRYIDNTKAYSYGERVTGPFGTEYDPLLEMMREVETAAGVPAERVDNFRWQITMCVKSSPLDGWQIMKCVGSSVLDGKRFNLSNYFSAVARSIINRALPGAKHEPRAIADRYEWHLWTQLGVHAQAPEELTLPAWMMITAERVMSDREAIYVGRAVLLGVNIRKCEALFPALQRTVFEAIGLAKAMPLSWNHYLAECKDNFDHYLRDSLSQVIGYHPYIAADILNYVQRSLSGSSATLPFPLNQAGRYT